MNSYRDEVKGMDRLTLEELRDAWPALSADERLEGFRLLPRIESEDFFLALSARDMAEVVLGFAPDERRSWIRLAPPDDVADLIQCSPHDQREHLLALLDEPTRKEVAGLLAYSEDEAGGASAPFVATLVDVTGLVIYFSVAAILLQGTLL